MQLEIRVRRAGKRHYRQAGATKERRDHVIIRESLYSALLSWLLISSTLLDYRPLRSVVGRLFHLSFC
jgi:hypothetical protein